MALNEIISDAAQKTDPTLQFRLPITQTSPVTPSIQAAIPTPQVNNDQLYTELQENVNKRAEIAKRYAQEIETAEPKLKKIREDQIIEHQNRINELNKILFPEQPIPKPPEIKDVQSQLGVIGSLMTGLMAVVGMLHGSKGAVAFTNSYIGMIDAFKRYDYENFMTASKNYEDKLKAVHLQTEQSLNKYQDQFNRMIRGMAEADEIAKLKAEAVEKPLAMHLQALQFEEKAIEAQEKLSEFFGKELFKAQIKALYGGPKTESEEMLIDKMKHSPDPKERQRAKENLDELLKRKKEVAFETGYGGTMGRGKAEEEISPPFAKWSPQEKEFMFKRAALGFTPRFAFGDRKSYTQFYKELGDYETGKGVTGEQFEAGVGEAKALKGSLNIQERAYGMMTGFVTNLSRQVDRLKEITKDVQRYDTRLANVPLVDWRTRVAGTPYENKIAMYVVEISTEIGKIATGSQASVRELSVQTRERWEKIHDPNLSIKDLIDVMEETKHAANIRKDSSLDAIKDTQKRLKEVGEPLPTEITSLPPPSGGIVVDPSKIKKGW
jgi:hypothetical protein